MRWIEVKKSNKLTGSIMIPGSKNSSLALLTACCLASEPVTLKNVPDILDIKIITEIGNDIGLKIDEYEDYIIVDPRNINNSKINHDKSASYRASYYFIGALLSKFKVVSIGYPGGDDFGSRPIDQHVKGLEALGAKVSFYTDHYVVEAEELIGADIYFDVISSGATINLLLASVLANGKTILRNAAKDPEVVDLAIFLNKMGAKIKGVGTDTITIEGVKELTSCIHSVIPDRLVAGSFLMCAGLSDGDITVKNIIPEHLTSFIAKVRETGLCIEEGDDYIRAYKDNDLQGVSVKTAMYPGFATDLQQPLTSMLIGAESHSTIIDKVYPGRFNHCIELNKMGAGIIIRENEFVIPGKHNLKGAWVHASDVRAGISLILAGLMASGTTCITGVEHIERGYTDIVEAFISLGADMEICEDANLEDGDIECLQKNVVN